MGEELATSQNVTVFKWSVRRERAALACATNRTEKAAADECGLSRETISRLMQEPEFLARVREHLKPARERALIELERAAPEAAKTVVELSFYGLPGHTVRLAAAKDVLDRTGLKPTEKVEVDATHRIEDARERLEQKLSRIIDVTPTHSTSREVD